MKKVTLIGNEAEVNKHLPFWESIPEVQVEQAIISNDNLDSLPAFRSSHDQSELFDVCVSAELKPSILKRLRMDVPIILVSPIASSLMETKDLLNYLKREQMLVRIVNPMMTSPELMNLHQTFSGDQLGHSGVNRISFQSERLPSNGRFLQQEFELIGWIYQTFGDFKTIFAKEINNRFISIHIRHEDNSFTHLEFARGFGKEELNIEMTGSEGMLTYKSSEANPISIVKTNQSTRKVHPIGIPLIQRQLEDGYEVLTKNRDSFNNITEIMKAIEWVEAIESSLNQAAPVTKGGV
ncbi:hypothetical protein ACTNEO_06345 [Gracilibacillus sp. HCP3S3_G5_1]|uniref:hypothetical protein n=1 Tax=unclassified Gracilibacillus TaxID=2625209 RepID=UPI003F8A2AD5